MAADAGSGGLSGGLSTTKRSVWSSRSGPAETPESPFTALHRLERNAGILWSPRIETEHAGHDQQNEDQDDHPQPGPTALALPLLHPARLSSGGHGEAQGLLPPSQELYDVWGHSVRSCVPAHQSGSRTGGAIWAY